MNPMQRFVPGLGQPIDFAAMAAGQGIGGGNPLAEALGGYRQQNTLAAAPTLGNPQAQQAQQADLAAMMEAYKAAQGQQALGESMMTPEYVQNSGALGALAMIAQAAAGHKLAKDATKTATERASEIFAEEQRREQEKAQAQAKAAEAAQARTWAREDQRDAAKAERERALVQMRIDEANRRAELVARSRIEAAAIAARGQGQGAPAGRILTGDEAKAAGLDPGGRYWIDGRTGKPTVIQAPAETDPVQARADTETQAARASLADDALRFAANYTGRSYDDLAKMTPEEVGKVVAESGGRFTTGPLIGRIVGDRGPNDDLLAFAESAAARQARVNNPTGQVTGPDIEAARLQVWGPTMRPETNAQLIQRAIESARPSGTSSVDALLEKYR